MAETLTNTPDDKIACVGASKGNNRGGKVPGMATTFTITIDDAGKFGVSGQLEDKILCFGLLEAAKDAVRQFHQDRRPMVQAVSVIPSLPLNGRVG